ncbi:MAG: tRNA adenosine(34) deaminase TadA [Thermodesulfobacteriota bacterium]
MADVPATPLLPPDWPDWEALMRLALEQARQAAAMGEVPVGAVLVSREGHILARAHNAPISRNDPTAHAEILALRQAAELTANYRLDAPVLVATLEPCLMCMGAMVHARIGGLVFGARDPKTGAALSCLEAQRLPFLNHTFPVLPDVLAEECGGLLREFFAARRGKGA